MCKKIYLLIIVVIITILSACSDTVDKINLKSKDNSRTGGITHGVISPDPTETDFTLTYNGLPIELTYMFENGKVDDVWGFCIYVEGLKQPFSVNNDSQKHDMYIMNFSANEYKELKVNFIPVVGKKDEILEIVFVAMLNPNFVLDISENNEVNQYGNNHVITQMPWRIKMNKSVQNALDGTVPLLGDLSDIPENFRKKFDIESPEQQPSNILDSSVVFELFSNSPEEASIENTTGNLELTINAAGCYPEYGKPITYRLFLYVDHQLLNCFSDKSYADIKVSKDKLTTLKISIDRKVLKNKNFIYLIAIPISEEKNYEIMLPMQKTESKILNVRNN